MRARFDWQTEEDGAWEELDAPESLPEATTRPVSARILSSRLPLILLFLFLGSLIFFMRRQVLLAEAEVRREVIAAHALAVEAAFASDAELFRTMLSGRDAGWTDTQIVLATQELALGNAARLFGLEPRPGPVTPEIISISPELNEVELSVAQRYLAAPPGTAATAATPITLTQTLIYRRGSAQWLLSPPEDKSAFWGRSQSITGRYLSILYPGRDDDLVRRLAADIDADLAAACARLPEGCPDDRHITLRLERNPASLLVMSHRRVYDRAENTSVVMPTPSLIGRPVDDAGYAHLQRAYSAYIVGLALTRVVDYECCRHVAYFHPLLQWSLADAQLVHWPLAGRNYATLLASPYALDTLQDLYDRSDPAFLSPEEDMLVHAFVEFMLVKAAGREELTPDLSTLGDMTARLADHTGFWGWVESMSGYSSRDEEQLVQDWWRFAAGRPPATLLAGH